MSVDRVGGFAVVATALLALTSGCGDSEFELAPVSGIIKLDGQVMPGTTVVFQPRAKAGSKIAGPGSTGTCDSEGRYHLAMQTAEGEPGAVVGKHQVSIYSKKSDQSITSDVDIVQQVERFPPQFNYKTTLAFEVTAAGADSADFDLSTDP